MVFIDESCSNFSVLIRCVQGHTDEIAARLVRFEAFEKATSAYRVLVHYTNEDHLRTIIGPGPMAQGLVPGGLVHSKNKGHRREVYLSTSMPLPDGSLPDRFLKPCTTVAIRLDSTLMEADGFALATAASGTVLSPDLIGAEYITYVTFLQSPKYTIYFRPSRQQMKGVTQQLCQCPSCGANHRSDTMYCLSCWEPMTWGAVKERLQHVSQAHDKKGPALKNSSASMASPKTKSSTTSGRQMVPWSTPSLVETFWSARVALRA